MASVGIVGAGTMGSGIAIAFADAGYDVVVVDAARDALERSRQLVERNYESQLAKGRLDEAAVGVRTSRIGRTTKLTDVARCEVVIEAVYESLELKASIFEKVSAVCPSETILATNTSSLDVDAIAQAASHPERCLGMHFFSPAHIMKLVEVIRGTRSSPATIEAACTIARDIGKTPVVVGNADGFVGNRMLLGYRREAEFLVLAGAQPREVDDALTAFGFAMGPFAVADLAGIDIGVSAKRERAARGAAPPFALTDISDRLVAAGRLGRKSGSGYYRYGNGDDPRPDGELAAIVAAERERLGVALRAVPAAEIVERCVLALVNEGARILEAGVADTADDIDCVWRLGYGFPAAHVGPMHFAASLGYAAVLARMEEYARNDAIFWKPATLLRRWAMETSTL